MRAILAVAVLPQVGVERPNLALEPVATGFRHASSPLGALMEAVQAASAQHPVPLVGQPAPPRRYRSTGRPGCLREVDATTEQCPQ